VPAQWRLCVVYTKRRGPIALKIVATPGVCACTTSNGLAATCFLAQNANRYSSLLCSPNTLFTMRTSLPRAWSARERFQTCFSTAP
jgi:hypothetical protein